LNWLNVKLATEETLLSDKCYKATGEGYRGNDYYIRRDCFSEDLIIYFLIYQVNTSKRFIVPPIYIYTDKRTPDEQAVHRALNIDM
jgi:hypothetical protein